MNHRWCGVVWYGHVGREASLNPNPIGAALAEAAALVSAAASAASERRQSAR